MDSDNRNREASLRRMVNPLLAWYARERRDLPWRRDRDPYHVWVSEIMLQQTRVEAVMRYYERFMRALPDVNALASVPDDRLMKLWEGLGYYSRARHLKEAAVRIVREGAFPDSFDGWKRLPGVGDYTAGAVASICFGERVPAVDGNVLRVTARVTADDGNVLQPAVRKKIRAMLDAVLHGAAAEEPGLFNEALMELGERVCLPGSAARCDVCPLGAVCDARLTGRVDELPVREGRTGRRQAQKTVLLLMSPDGRVAIEKRPARGLLAGMYQLPNLDGFLSGEEIRSALCARGVEAEQVDFMKEARHVFTHIEWQMRGFRVKAVGTGGTGDGLLWVTPGELISQYALPSAFRPFVSEIHT